VAVTLVCYTCLSVCLFAVFHTSLCLSSACCR